MRKLIIIIVIILLIGAYVIIRAHDMDIKTQQGRKAFVSLFSKWTFKLGKNVISLASYAIKQDWSTPKNDTKTTS